MEPMTTNNATNNGPSNYRHVKAMSALIAKGSYRASPKNLDIPGEDSWSTRKRMQKICDAFFEKPATRIIFRSKLNCISLYRISAFTKGHGRAISFNQIGHILVTEPVIQHPRWVILSRSKLRIRPLHSKKREKKHNFENLRLEN